MRRLLCATFAGAFALAPVASAHATGAGSIDHLDASGRTVKMLFSVPSETAAPDLDSVVVKVGGTTVDATATPVKAGEIKRTTVLALDVSDSMKGERFEAAKQAALTYLDNAPADVAVGLVTFAGEVTVIDSPTTDHASLEQAIGDLALSRGTALYDGVLEALVQAGPEGQRDVIVLSDGADTTSTQLDDVVAGAKESDVGVNVVALEQSRDNQAKLRQITDASEGTVLPADDPAALAAVFRQEADALAQQILIEFEAPRSGEATVTASLETDGETYTDSAFATLTAPESSPVANGKPLPVEPSGPAVDTRFLYGGLSALGLGIALILGLLLIGKPKRGQGTLIERQLSFYGAGAPQPHASVHMTASRPQVNVRDSAVAAAGKLAEKAGFEERLTQRLSAAGVALTTAEWLLLHAGVAIVSALVGMLLGGLVAMVLFLALGAAGPWLFLALKAGRRLKAFGSQLPDTLQLMSGGLSAGLSLPQAVDTVVREGSEPMAGELRRSLVEQRLGVDIEDALDGVAERMQSKDFTWVVMAIRVQREVGGNLAELLNTVAGTMREREYLRRQVKTLSAEGRLSAWILGGLPVGFALYLSVSQPEYLEKLYTTPFGLMLAGVGVVLLTLGAFVMKSLVKVEV
jgi:tight adherence protein B